MSDRLLVRLERGLALAAAAMALVTLLVSFPTSLFVVFWTGGGSFFLPFTVFLFIVVWLVAPREPRNPVVRFMTLAACLAGVHALGETLAVLVGDPAAIASNEVPARFDPVVSWLLGLSSATGFAALFLFLTFGLLLFPHGRFSSPRWRWVGSLAVVGLVVVSLGAMWSYRPWSTVASNSGPIYTTGVIVSLIAVLLSVLSLVRRFRESSGATHQQIKWIALGASPFVPVIVVGLFVGQDDPVAFSSLIFSATLFLIASYGIALIRYRLFDVDVVISRAIVLTGLAAFITLVYAVLVGAVGLLLGNAGATLPLSVAATVVVAVAFQPVRFRMRRWADRLVYGERATPYEVLSRFSARMRDAVSPEDLIPQMARLLTQGTGASRATVWMRNDGGFRPVANWPAEEQIPAPITDGADPKRTPGVDHFSPVEHDGEILGAVTVTMSRGEELTATGERLVDDLASQAGLVLRNARLTADLFDTIRQLRTSRQRLVTAQDEERRRLERDLHDGAQQQIIAVKMKVALARRSAQEGDTARAVQLLDEMSADTADAIETLRDLAHGIYPPMLEAEGLGPALTARARRAPLAVSVQTDGVGRYPPEVEAAIYFCVLEAVQNAVKYARCDLVTVALEQTGDGLTFEVRDEGVGFDADHRSVGRGLVNMADRLDALGGTLAVRSTPDEGTIVRGTLEVSPLVEGNIPRDAVAVRGAP